jgi:hypothetical protein
MLFIILFLVCPLFAALDSAATVNGIQHAGKVAEFIANITGHNTAAQFIGLVIAAAVPVVSFIFGHSHGKKKREK